jgi:hypothetical protein
MLEGFTELPLNDAYAELRRILLDMKCQLLWTIPPDAIEVRQGSWLGLSPTSMAKHLRFRLFSESEGTRLEAVAYWPMILIASLISFYTACIFLLGLVALLVTQAGTLTLLTAPFGLIVLILGGLVIVLGMVHIYSYLKRSKAIQNIMLLIKARGSPLHRKIREARIRKAKI